MKKKSTYSEYLIFTFESTSQAIKAEADLLGAGYKVTIIPVPSAIKKGCGIAFKISVSVAKNAVKIITNTDSVTIYNDKSHDYSIVDIQNLYSGYNKKNYK